MSKTFAKTFAHTFANLDNARGRETHPTLRELTPSEYTGLMGLDRDLTDEEAEQVRRFETFLEYWFHGMTKIRQPLKGKRT